MEMCTDTLKLGLCSISFRDLSPREVTELVKNAGLDCIEWGSDVHARPEDTDSIAEIVSLQKETGIYCSSYGTYFRIDSDKTEDIYKYITAAKALGTDTLRLWCGRKGSGEYSQEELERVYAQCRDLAEIAEKEEVYLCLECHIKTLTDSLSSAKALIEHVNSKHFCMYWQPNQFKDFETNLDYAKWASGCTKCVHVFNWREKEKYPLADAKEIWQNYLECFDGVTLLLEFMPDGRRSTLETEANSLFDITGRKK